MLNKKLDYRVLKKEDAFYYRMGCTCLRRATARDCPYGMPLLLINLVCVSILSILFRGIQQNRPLRTFIIHNSSLIIATKQDQKRLYKAFITGFLFLVSSLSTEAQSLQHFLSSIKENNLSIKALEQDYQAALELAPQVSQIPDPMVNVGVMPLPVETRLGPQWAKIGATQQLPRKAHLQAKANLMDAMAEAQYGNIGITELDLAYQVKVNYYKIYELEKTHDILDQNIRIQQVLERLALAKIESGKGSMANVLRIQLQIQELEERKALLHNKKTRHAAVINQITGRPLSAEVVLNENLSLAVLPYEKDSLAGLIRQTHPLFQMLEAKQEVSNRAMKVNQLAQKPVFGVGMDYIVVTKRTDASPKHNGRDIIMPRASVNIPLIRKKYAAKDREEELKIVAIETRKQDALDRFLLAVEQAYTDHQEAKIKLNLYQKQTQTLKRTIDLLITQYTVSGKGFDELLQLHDQIVVYDTKTVQAIRQSHEAKAAVERFVP